MASRFESRRRSFAALIPTAALSSLGSLAYKLALVAAGRYDGYLSWRRTHDWDIAAAVLLLDEAGGRDRGCGWRPDPPQSARARAFRHPRRRDSTRSCSTPLPAPTPPIGPTAGRAACRIEPRHLLPGRRLW